VYRAVYRFALHIVLQQLPCPDLSRQIFPAPRRRTNPFTCGTMTHGSRIAISLHARFVAALCAARRAATLSSTTISGTTTW
jgi:hypothetical protein